PVPLHDLDRRGLPGAVRSEKGEDLPVTDLDVDPANHLVLAVGLAQPANTDNRRTNVRLPIACATRLKTSVRVLSEAFVSGRTRRNPRPRAQSCLGVRVLPCSPPYRDSDGRASRACR